MSSMKYTSKKENFPFFFKCNYFNHVEIFFPQLFPNPYPDTNF